MPADIIPEKLILQNGFPVIFLPLPNNPLVAITVAVRGGMRHETKRTAGIAHLQEHGLFDGGAVYQDTKTVAKVLQKIRANQGAYTGEEEVCYYAECDASDIDIVINVFTDMFCAGQNRESDLAKNKKIIAHEFTKTTSDPDQFFWHDLSPPRRFPNHPLGFTTYDEQATLAGITTQDIANYRNTFYAPQNMCIALAGDPAAFTRELSLQLENGFGRLNGNAPPAWEQFMEREPSQRIHILEHDGIEETTLVIAIPCHGYQEHHYMVRRLIATILGDGMSSRLFLTVREKLQLCYVVGAFLHEYEETGSFFMQVKTDAEKMTAAASAMLDELKNLADEPVPEDELMDIKQGISKELRRVILRPAEVTDAYAKRYLMKKNLRTLNEGINEMMDISRQDIMREAQNLLENLKHTQIFAIVPTGTKAPADALEVLLPNAS